MSDLPPDAPQTPPSNAELLHAFLIGRDVPCPRCGYNLRDATGDVCVECGLALRLAVAADEPFRKMWVVAMVALALPAGVGLLMLSVLLSHRVGLLDQNLLVRVGVITFLASVPATGLLVTFRRRFSRMPADIQRAVAFACVIASVAGFAFWTIGRGH